MPRARASGIVAAPIEAVWKLVREFDAHTPWIHGATSIELIGGGPTTIGVTREVHFVDGVTLRERLIGLDDHEWTASYDLTGEIPWPIFNVRGAIQLLPVTMTNSTFVHRFVDFETLGGETEAREMCAGLSERLGESLDLIVADPRLRG